MLRRSATPEPCDLSIQRPFRGQPDLRASQGTREG